MKPSTFQIKSLSLYTALAITSLNSGFSPCFAEADKSQIKIYRGLTQGATEPESVKYLPVFRQLRESELTKLAAGSLEQFPYTQLAEKDTGCALACVRVHVERRLSDLAAPTCESAMPKGINELLAHLQWQKVLNSRQVLALQRLTALLNDSAHGLQVINPEVTLWIKEESPRLLVTLERLALRRL